MTTERSRARSPKATTIGGGAKAPPRIVHDPPRRVLLATAAMPIDRALIERTIAIAAPEHAKITVLGVARVYGTSLGFPNPGLQPNRLEIAELKEILGRAEVALREEGFEVRVAMSKSRNAPKMIARWAKAKNFHAIVVADPERPKWRRRLEGDVRKEINRHCNVPVFTVPVPATSHRSARPS